MENKEIKVVTLTIKASRLLDEREKSIMFKNTGRGKGLKPIVFPKSCMYNFEKVIVYFPHWKGRKKEKAFKFDIPYWLFIERSAYEIPALGDNVIVKNTHEKF